MEKSEQSKNSAFIRVACLTLIDMNYPKAQKPKALAKFASINDLFARYNILSRLGFVLAQPCGNKRDAARHEMGRRNILAQKQT